MPITSILKLTKSNTGLRIKFNTERVRFSPEYGFNKIIRRFSTRKALKKKYFI
jgi:hypothetical protein